MKASLAFVLCSVVGSALGYYIQRDTPYNVGPNDPYSVIVDPNYLQVPSQRLFFNWGQGTNQVGGTGWWATLTNKFPFLSTMFGKMELPPNQYGVPSYQQPPQFGYQPQFAYQQPQAQFYPSYQQAFYPQNLGQYFGNQVPVRDVALTDDSVIVTPPHVPAAPPQFAPEPAPGYQYNKPQIKFELPHK